MPNRVPESRSENPRARLAERRLDEQDRRDPVTKRKSRLLAAFLLLMTAVFAASDVISLLTRPGYMPPWYGYVFLISAFVFNTSGLYTVAASLTLTMFPLVTFVSVISGTESPGPTFSYLVIGIIGSTLLLERKGAILFDAGCFFFLLLTPTLIPQRVPNLQVVLVPLILVAIGSGLSIILMIHRDELERERQAVLRASEERLRLALEASSMGTWEWEAGSSEVRLSEQVRDLFGLESGDASEAVAAYFRAVHPDDRTEVEQALGDVMSGHTPRFTLLHRVIWPDGTVRWIQLQGRSGRGEGDRRRVNGTVLDVTDRKKAEIERDELIQELERKNAELERFTYTVSHDLKSPLITIRGFLGSIEEDLNEGRGDRLVSDVQRIFNATSRMQRLLEELLSLSRIGRIANPPERVAFAELVREAADQVRGRLDAARAHVDIRDDLPDVYGDRSRLVQVLQNLFDNAARFMGGQKDPLITVGSRPAASEGRPVFYVEDNGVGIAPSDLERVLGLFEKLDEGGDGTGVGLAIVKRIVEVHGGKVWVESAGRGLGTTVCFTLPTRAPV